MGDGGAPTPRTRLCRSWLARPSWEVAPELLGMVLSHGAASGRIVEVEAYTEADAASHSFRGRTARNAVMFGPAGHLYVYFTYGMHYCANVVTGHDGEGSGVLLRALAPRTGTEVMRERRGEIVRTDADLCSGPAKLCQAMGLERSHDGTDLLRGDGPRLRRGLPVAEREIVATKRVGIRVARERPWRWYVAGDPNVSRPR